MVVFKFQLFKILIKRVYKPFIKGDPSMKKKKNKLYPREYVSKPQDPNKPGQGGPNSKAYTEYGPHHQFES